MRGKLLGMDPRKFRGHAHYLSTRTVTRTDVRRFGLSPDGNSENPGVVNQPLCFVGDASSLKLRILPSARRVTRSDSRAILNIAIVQFP